MNLRRISCLGLCTLTLALAPACGGDDSEEDTAADEVDTSTSGSETTDTGAEADTTTTTTDTGGTTETDTGGSTETDTGGSTGPGTETDTGGGETSGVEVCDSCGADEYCHASIIDAPTEYSCEPIPNRCGDMSTCDCIAPIVCPETLQSCEELDGLITVECVEG